MTWRSSEQERTGGIILSLTLSLSPYPASLREDDVFESFKPHFQVLMEGLQVRGDPLAVQNQTLP